MDFTSRNLAEEYRAALEECLAGAGEAALKWDYDLGRQALDEARACPVFVRKRANSWVSSFLRM